MRELEQELLMQMPKKRKRVFHTLDAFGEYQTCAYKDIKLDFSKSPFSNNLNDKKFKPNNIPDYSRQFNQFDNPITNQNNKYKNNYHIWSKSFEPTEVSVKKFNDGSELHTHHTKEGFITGANIRDSFGNKSILNNYQSCMLDIFGNKKKGGF